MTRYRSRTPAEANDPERASFLAGLRQEGILPHKRLGQVFLIRRFIAEEMVRRAGLTDRDVVVEIGTGLGILTVPLAESGARIIGLEYDSRLASRLKSIMHHRNVEIIREDALNYDYRGLYQRYRTKLKIVGNLPYYLTSPLIFRLLELRPFIAQLLLMIQKEVAERIIAGPGTRRYGTLSIFTQLYCQVWEHLSVTRDYFYPRPAVDSTVVEFAVHSTPRVPVADEQAFAKLVRVAFAQRRKTLLNALKGSDYFNRGKEGTLEALKSAGIDPQRRPETLSIEEYARLSAALFPHHTSPPTSISGIRSVG